MSPWFYHNPVEVHVGAGLLQSLPRHVPAGTWLLVTTKGFTKRALTQKVCELLPHANVLVYDSVTPNPELDDLEQAVHKYRLASIDGIIALGGGSVLDAAKVLSVAIPSELEQPLQQVLRQGQSSTWSVKLPLIAIPSTAGTGAEVTPFATVWDSTEHKKYSVTGVKVCPDKAILDPQLTVSLPYQETLFTGLDAISHALESLWNVNRTPISMSYALQALREAVQAMPQALSQPTHLPARAGMQVASLLAGLAISQTRTAIAHSVSYPLTSHYAVPHGLACSFMLPYLIEQYLTEHPNVDESQLLKQVGQMIKSFNLQSYINSYLTVEQALSLANEMYHPDRVGNYTGSMSSQALDQMILSGFVAS